MKAHKLVTLLLLIGMVTALFGGSARSAQAAPTTLLVWTAGSEDDALVMLAAANLWTARTGNQVKIESVSWDDLHAKILAAVTSGQGPDMITGGLSYGIEFGGIGGMVDLSHKYPKEVKAMQAASNPGIWASIAARNGSIYGVPYDLTTYLLYYRPDLLQKAGIKSVPASWSQLTAAIAAVRKANKGKGGFALDWGNTQWLGYASFLYQAGGDFYSADCKKVTINSSRGLQALRFYASLYRDYGVPTDTAPDLEGGLVSGLYPLGMTGDWLQNLLKANHPEIQGKWKVAPLPAGPTGKHTSLIGGRIIGVMSYSKSVDTAFDFIKYLYSEEGVRAEIVQSKRTNATFLPSQVAYQSLISTDVSVIQAFKAQLADAKGPPSCVGWEAASKQVQQRLNSVIFDGADPKAALDAAATDMTILLK